MNKIVRMEKTTDAHGQWLIYSFLIVLGIDVLVFDTLISLIIKPFASEN